MCLITSQAKLEGVSKKVKVALAPVFILTKIRFTCFDALFLCDFFFGGAAVKRLECL